MALPVEELAELQVVVGSEHGTALAELCVKAVKVIPDHTPHREAGQYLRGGRLDGMDPAL